MLEGFNHHTGRDFYWLVNPAFGWSAGYDTSGAACSDPRARALCARHSIPLPEEA